MKVASTEFSSGLFKEASTESTGVVRDSPGPSSVSSRAICCNRNRWLSMSVPNMANPARDVDQCEVDTNFSERRSGLCP
ncbi:hypothetical protein PENSPDRAFT_456154 [Peniophora sp. CONT]|nr:hypothetical protein PENSPDRAFT_456154 [Peniophora sp. CONT]